MDTFEVMNSGRYKNVSNPDSEGYVTKVFKEPRDVQMPYEDQKRLLKKKIAYFGQYIPETKLCLNDDGSYYIKQKYINGKRMCDVDINSLTASSIDELVDFLKKYLNFCHTESIFNDVAGYQELYDKINDGNFLRKIYINLIIRYNRCVKNIFKSTNVLLSNDGHIYMVDVCDDVDKNQCLNLIQNLNKNLKKRLKILFLNINIKKLEKYKRKYKSELIETLK